MSFLTPYTQAAGMTTAAWMQLPVRLLPLVSLTPTQGIHGELWAERRPMPAACADPYIHVVQLGGAFYVEDGHHRLARARRARQTLIEARLLTIPPASAA